MTDKAEIKADVLTNKAVLWLLEQYPNALVIEEFCAGKYGSAMVDVAAVLPDRIVGIEIKGAGDSRARLQLQGLKYGAVCSVMFLLVSPSLENHVDGYVPGGWCNLYVREDLTLGTKNQEYGLGNPQSNLTGAPGALLGCLWKDELFDLAHAARLDVTRRQSSGELAHTVAENLPLKDIRRGVCSALRQRNWEQKTMNGGTKRLYHGKDFQRVERVYQPLSLLKGTVAQLPTERVNT